MKKKILTGLAAVACGFGMLAVTSCGSSDSVKVGFICLHDETSTYDKNFIEAAKDVCEEMGVEAVFKTQVEEGAEYDVAVELAADGCKAIFADSFGHESGMVKAAKEYDSIQFFHATGTKAHTEKLANYHNAFASIYEGRYLAGIVAGLKMNEMIKNGDIQADEAVMGYVGAYNYAEVVSGYTSFYLGAKSVCDSVTMKVRYTNSWFSVEKEAAAATQLIETDGCKLISQHADSQGAPGVCEYKGVPNVFYNGNNSASAPKTYLVASRINWRPFFTDMVKTVTENKEMAYDYIGTIASGSVELMEINESIAPAGTKETVATAKEALINGTLNVFDTDNFTVKNANLDSTIAEVDADGHLVSYKADVDDDGTYSHEKPVVSDGVFKESFYRSAPYFDIRIDGITELA